MNAWTKIPRGALGKLVLQAFVATTPFAVSACEQETLFVVNTTDDLEDADPGDGVCETNTGLCSLRAAVQEANAAPAGANFRIRLDNAGTYTVAENVEPGNGILVSALAKRVRIVGCCLGASSSIIEASGNTRHFTILGGAIQLERVTLRGGRGPDPGAPGIQHGGSIHLEGGGTRLEVVSSVLENNMAGSEGRGGAIFVAPDPQTQLVVSHSILRNNTASIGAVGGGGGIHSHGSTSISNTLFEDNEGNGGALRLEPASGNVIHEVLRSTFRRNRSLNSGAGGGIRANLGGSILFVSLSTFSSNETNSLAGGAALHASSGEVRLTSSTLTNNRALSQVHALRVSGSAYVTLQNTLIDANPTSFGSQSEVGCDAPATLVLDGHNFLDGMSDDCDFVPGDSAEGDTVGSANSLDADLGFYTSSPIGHHPLRPGSPAVDHGPTTCPGADQIGNPRPVGDRCDTGAIELQ